VDYRTFWDSNGRTWQVWLILPTAADRRAAERRHAVGATWSGSERRTEVRRLRTLFRGSTVPIGFEDGWLCFECESGEKRRLAPVPAEWELAHDEQLLAWCVTAAAVPKCDPG
jgi:hypothetical protein